MRALTLGLGLLALAPIPLAAQGLTEPPNLAATLEESSSRLSLTYEGHAIIEGALRADQGVTAERRMVTSESNGALTQVVKWTAKGQGRLTLDLTVYGSADALAVEVDRTRQHSPDRPREHRPEPQPAESRGL